MTPTTMRAVRFDRYGGREVLYVAEVDVPVPAPGQVLVKVKAAGINPGEAAVRSGALHERFPATFPSGQGSDFAGTVADTGAEVLGWSWERSSHAEYVCVPGNPGGAQARRTRLGAGRIAVRRRRRTSGAGRDGDGPRPPR